MEFVTTERGGRKLLFEGFCYVKQKELSGGKVCCGENTSAKQNYTLSVKEWFGRRTSTPMHLMQRGLRCWMWERRWKLVPKRQQRPLSKSLAKQFQEFLKLPLPWCRRLQTYGGLHTEISAGSPSRALTVAGKCSRCSYTSTISTDFPPRPVSSTWQWCRRSQQTFVICFRGWFGIAEGFTLLGSGRNFQNSSRDIFSAIYCPLHDWEWPIISLRVCLDHQ